MEDKSTKNKIRIVEKSKIIELLDYYNIPNEVTSGNYPLSSLDEILERCFYFANEGDVEIHKIAIKPQEIAMLIEFLRECKGKDIELRSQTKKGYRTIKLTNQVFISELELYANNFLARLLKFNLNGFSESKLGIEPKDCSVNEYENKPEIVIEPYTDKEINKILMYYRDLDESFHAPKGNVKLGRIAKALLDILPKACVSFSNTIKYSFIYDVMDLYNMTGKEDFSGEGFRGAYKGKKIKVRDWLKAYNNHLHKQ